jgi:hypothetical protein
MESPLERTKSAKPQLPPDGWIEATAASIESARFGYQPYHRESLINCSDSTGLGRNQFCLFLMPGATDLGVDIPGVLHLLNSVLCRWRARLSEVMLFP